MCANAYQKALDCLPSDESSLTDAQKAMKKQFTDGLKTAEAGKRRPDNPYVVVDQEAASKGLPWDRARFVIARQRPSKKSSVRPFALVPFYRQSHRATGLRHTIGS